MEWSCVLPVKDELDYLHYSLPSIVRLRPSEIVLCLDYVEHSKPTYPSCPIEDYATKVCNEAKVPLVVVRVRKDSERAKKWKFFQAYVRRCGYEVAKFPKIFTFDVDTIVTPEILKGYDIVGKDGVTFITFRKKLAISSFIQSLRSILYDIRRSVPARKALSVNKIKQPFIGIYWLWRPYYLNLIREEVVSKIYNGEDTLAQMLVESHSFYKHIHRDDLLGCISLRHENEDTKWRQEQLGIYWGCCHALNTAIIAKYMSFLKVFVQFTFKIYPHVVCGYFMGRNYPQELAKKIREHSYAEMIMYSKYTNGIWHYDYPP